MLSAVFPVEASNVLLQHGRRFVALKYVCGCADAAVGCGAGLESCRSDGRMV
jgi:hypothetical protein